MKRLLFTLAIGSLGSLAVFAQNLTITPSSISLDVLATETDVHSTITMQNTAASAKTFKWERSVLSISPNCQTQVCDPNNCYLPGTSTKQFNLAAGATGIMQVHFLNTTGLLGCALVNIKITEVGNDANTVTAEYLFNDCSIVLADDEAFGANIRLFPNPTTDAFTLENAKNVQVVRVFSMDGREVKKFDAATFVTTFPVGDLAAGNYVVVLQDRSGKALKTVELKKN